MQVILLFEKAKSGKQHDHDFVYWDIRKILLAYVKYMFDNLIPNYNYS